MHTVENYVVLRKNITGNSRFDNDNNNNIIIIIIIIIILIIIILLYIYIAVIEFSTIFMVCLPSTVLCKFLGLGLFTILCHTVIRRSHPSQINSLGSIQVCKQHI